MKKFVFSIIAIVFTLVLLLPVLSACDKALNREMGIYAGEEKVSEFVADGDNYYAKLTPSQDLSLTVVDAAKESHNLSLKANQEYTLVALKSSGGYKVEAWPQKRAVIWVTALLSGGFYDESLYNQAMTGEEPVVDEDDDSILTYSTEEVISKKKWRVWDPLPFDDIRLIDYINPDTMEESIPALIEKLTGDLKLVSSLAGGIAGGKKNSGNLFWNLGVDTYGNPNNPNVKTAMGVDDRIQYGVLSAYQEHANHLRNEFSDMDVVIFDYDWRMDNRKSSQALQDLIYENKYTDIVLFSHSLGGNIVAGYLANNALNRSLVKRYVSFGGAFLGSFDALFAIEDIEMYLGKVMEGMGMNIDELLASLPKWLVNMLPLNKIFEGLQEFVKNMDSFVQLVPTYALISGLQYGENGDGDAITVDGRAISSEEELYAFYESRPWAWQRDAAGKYVLDAAGNHVLRKATQDLKEYHHSLYVENEDGTSTFSTFLVDTYYVTGTNIDTFCGADYIGSGEDATLEVRMTKNGDKQVLLYSTLVNQPLQQVIDANHYIEYPNRDHFQVGCDYELVKDTIRSNIYAAFYPDMDIPEEPALN